MEEQESRRELYYGLKRLTQREQTYLLYRYGFDAPQLFLSRQNIVQRNALVADTVLILRHHPLLKSSKGIPNHVHHGVMNGRSRIGQELHAARCIELRQRSGTLCH